MKLFVIGLSYHSAPISLRERFSLNPEDIEFLSPRLQKEENLREVVLLNTCNRVEIYGVTVDKIPDPKKLFNNIASIIQHKKSSGCFNEVTVDPYCHIDEICVRHLFRVASGLDSMVFGETEILGQVKQAYQVAHAYHTTGKILNKLFQRAFSVAKEVRTHSGIGRWPTSVGSVAVKLMTQVFGDDLTQRTALIIGAGKMGETALKHLVKHGVGSILVANRSPKRASELTDQFGGESVPFLSLSKILPQVDIVISSTTAPYHILRKKDIAGGLEQREGRSLFLIDLAVPRDIEPSVEELEGVYVFNIDQLAEVAQQNMAKRQAEAAPCEKLMTAHIVEFVLWLATCERVSYASSIIQKRYLANPFRPSFAGTIVSY